MEEDKFPFNENAFPYRLRLDRSAWHHINVATRAGRLGEVIYEVDNVKYYLTDKQVKYLNRIWNKGISVLTVLLGYPFLRKITGEMFWSAVITFAALFITIGIQALIYYPYLVKKFIEEETVLTPEIQKEIDDQKLEL